MRDPWAKLYMILYGDRGESGKIYLTPSDGTRFEAGKQYRVSVNIKDIGKVSWIFLSFFFFFFSFSELWQNPQKFFFCRNFFNVTGRIVNSLQFDSCTLCNQFNAIHNLRTLSIQFDLK